MKPSITRIRDMSSSLLAMRNEHWHYLLVFGVVISLALLFVGSVAVNIYQTTMLAVTSSQEITAINRYRHEIKLEAIKPEVTRVSDWHLFGSPPIAASSIVKGSFNLIGIEYSTLDPSKAKAIISNNSGDEGIYRVGEKIPQGAIVERIDPQQVTLLYNGTIEVLSLKWDDDQNIINTANSQSSSQQNLNQGEQQPGIPPELHIKSRSP